MSKPTTRVRALEHAYLRPLVRRLKKIFGIGRLSAVARRVDQLAPLEPHVADLTVVTRRMEELERRIEELEALCREQVGLQYLQLATAAVDAPAEAPFSQRRAE
jgi:hypothetical protein